MYQFFSKVTKKYFDGHEHKLFKWGFNLSPMYRRSTGRVTSVTKGFYRIEIKIPISYRNRNYVGTIFGGSLFSATDPIFMVQLIQILGNDYVVWDKSSKVKFKRPASTDAYSVFEFSEDEIKELKKRVSKENEIDLIKLVEIKGDQGQLFCEIEKTIYVADKAYYKKKKKKSTS